MKANEVPNKIYLQVCGDCPQTDCATCKFEDLGDVTWNEDRIFPKDVEYTRTDAFIDKAIKWISNNCYIPHATLEDFRKYMEGE